MVKTLDGKTVDICDLVFANDSMLVNLPYGYVLEMKNNEKWSMLDHFYTSRELKKKKTSCQTQMNIELLNCIKNKI